MNRDKVIAAAALAAVVVGALVSLQPDDLGERPVTGRVPRLGESKLVLLPDGGKGYSYPAYLEDGGQEYLVTDEAPCVRRAVGMPESSCRRRLEDGGAFDFGELNRFPATEAVGEGCEPVACSVVAGENADEPEDERIRRMKDGGM